MTAQERAALIVRQAIEKSGLTARQVAERAGMDEASISHLVKGIRDPRLGTLFRILEACNMEFVEIRIRRLDANTNKT